MSGSAMREVDFGNNVRAVVDLSSPVARYPRNPILKAGDVNRVWTEPALQVTTVHNAGITTMDDETLMLFRSHLRSGLSVIGLARSKNGVESWSIDPQPFMRPADKDDAFAESSDPRILIENEGGGVEDPRVTKIDETYAITYSAYHGTVKNRVRISLATTSDFRSLMRFGPLLDRDMRNVVIFPEKIEGRYVALFRPNDITEGGVGGIFTQIRIGYSDGLLSSRWKMHEEPIMQTGFGPSAFSNKIGPGAPPIKTEKGWINIFHGVRTTMDGNPYVLGVALHDLTDPSRVKMSSIPILFPSPADCRVAENDYIHVPNVVFTCGALARADGSILIYYAGNDTVMNLGATHKDVLIALCEQYGQDPRLGNLLYSI